MVFVGVLKVKDENSRIRIRIYWSEAQIRGSGPVPKFHGSTTLFVGTVFVLTYYLLVLYACTFLVKIQPFVTLIKVWPESGPDPDLHCFGSLDMDPDSDPHWEKTRIRIRIGTNTDPQQCFERLSQDGGRTETAVNFRGSTHNDDLSNDKSFSYISMNTTLKVPKCEIFHLFDFYDFYGIKSL